MTLYSLEGIHVYQNTYIVQHEVGVRGVWLPCGRIDQMALKPFGSLKLPIISNINNLRVLTPILLNHVISLSHGCTREFKMA